MCKYFTMLTQILIHTSATYTSTLEKGKVRFMEEIQRSSWYDKYPTIILLQEFQKTSSPGGCLFGISKNHPTGLGLHRGRPHPWYPCWDLSLSTTSSPPRSIHLGKALVKHPTEDCHPKKHPSFSLSRGRLFRFFGEGRGIWRREWLIFWRFQWPFFFVLTLTRSSVEWKLFKWQC